MPPLQSPDTPEELAVEPAFIRWVQTPDAAADEAWQGWIATDPARLPLVEQARKLVQVMRFEQISLSDDEQERLARDLQQRLLTQPSRQRVPGEEDAAVPVIPLGGTPLGERSRWQRTAWLAAASVALVVLGFVYWLWPNQPVGQEYATTYGETKRIVLPDQSVVTLNANSRLRVAADWTPQTPREVWLDGEAFFAVRKQPVKTAPSAQFVVHSGQLTVRVLGTTFDVLRRRNTTQVVLNTGRVRLDGLPSGEQFMAPGDRVVYREAARQVVRSRVNPGDVAAWQQREWVLNDTPLSEIAAMLNDQFGLTVTFDTPELARRTLSGRMSVESADAFLENLTTILNVSVRKQPDGKIQISQP